MSSDPDTVQFWNRAWKSWQPQDIDPATFHKQGNQTHRTFVDLIGDVENQRVLEIGSGKGHLAVYLAKCGAQVTATDISQKSVDLIRENAEYNGVADRVTAHCLNALDLHQLNRSYSLVVGRFVLHHIEPFSALVEVLDKVMEPGGRGLFLENNARNKLLMLARDYLTGRMGIPKYGDDDEHPLTVDELDVLRQRFDVKCHFPELVFFKTINTYIFQYKDRYAKVVESMKRLDDFIYEHLPPIRKYSYLQIVEIVNSKEKVDP